MKPRFPAFPVGFFALLSLLGLILTAPFAVAQTNVVWVIPIEGEITSATAQFVASRIIQANDAQPLAVVLYIDTPGGQIVAAERIVNTILQDAQVPTIAVVANAFSAGAIIAMSAEEVAMLPGSSIGAATVINALTGESAGDKVNSAWRAQFRSVAEARGRNAQVAEAMVSERIEIPGLSTTEELVTLTPAQALEFNIADIQARNLRDALEQLGYGGVTLERLEPNLAERLGGNLANPLIAAALLVVGIGGILLEVLSPGFGIPGIIGILAFAAFGIGAFIATPAGPIDLLLIMAGVILLTVEVLFIPDFGLAGLLGIGAIITAIIRIFPNTDQLVGVLGYSALFSVVLVIGFFWMLPNSRFTKIFGLSTRLANLPGTTPEQARLIASYDYLLNARGVSSSDLRPAGVARFGTERIDVVTEGGYVPSGSDVEVVRVEGNRVVVRLIEG
jgi:membrane-bound serine protease (ClpP class)